MAVARERVHYDRFSTVITTSGYQDLRTYSISDNRTVRFEITLAARQSDGSHRATFKRVALLYREGGSVQIQGPTWQTLDTIKSDNSIDVKYVLGPNNITIQVRNASGATRWNGQVDIINVK